MKIYDVVVIGGGVIGLSIAYEIKFRHSKIKVAILEKTQTGYEASHASAGMLEPQLIMPRQNLSDREKAFFRLCRESQNMYEETIRRIEYHSRMDCEYRKEGILKLISPEIDPKPWLSWYVGLGMHAHFWSVEQTGEAEPALREGMAAIHLPDNHQVENRKLSAALAECCKNLGVDILEYSAVESIILNNEAIDHLQTKTGTVSAARYVLAAGAWSSQIPGLTQTIPEIKPIRGQIVAMQMPKPDFIRYPAYLEDFYYVPRNSGRLLIGSTVEDVGFDKAVTPSVIVGFIEKLRALIPQSKTFESVERWAGLRPCSADRLPLLGETRLTNLVVATGHFRNGILLMPITAKLIADMIITGKPSPMLAPFSPSRFNGSTNA